MWLHIDFDVTSYWLRWLLTDFVASGSPAQKMKLGRVSYLWSAVGSDQESFLRSWRVSGARTTFLFLAGSTIFIVKARAGTLNANLNCLMPPSNDKFHPLASLVIPVHLCRVKGRWEFDNARVDLLCYRYNEHMVLDAYNIREIHNGYVFSNYMRVLYGHTGPWPWPADPWPNLAQQWCSGEFSDYVSASFSIVKSKR